MRSYSSRGDGSSSIPNDDDDDDDDASFGIALLPNAIDADPGPKAEAAFLLYRTGPSGPNTATAKNTHAERTAKNAVEDLRCACSSLAAKRGFIILSSNSRLRNDDVKPRAPDPKTNESPKKKKKKKKRSKRRERRRRRRRQGRKKDSRWQKEKANSLRSCVLLLHLLKEEARRIVKQFSWTKRPKTEREREKSIVCLRE